ncbi:MAG: hypothetical protein KDD44_06720 [Bdellovibrionales bacterium]|nr:hypothetical protein [Bdellovibrionales bacterium]
MGSRELSILSFVAAANILEREEDELEQADDALEVVRYIMTLDAEVDFDEWLLLS